MLTPATPRRRWRATAATLVMTTTMLLPASATLALDPAAAEIEPAGGDLDMGSIGVDELRTMVDDLRIANDTLAADNATLQQDIEDLRQERDRLLGSLERFDALYEPLEADRQLLFELRKGLPETRPEAEAQLERLRSLALASDPAGLGRLVDRVDEAAPAFLDWRFGDFSSTEELSRAYIDSGANAFDASMEELRSEVLRSVANRLDGLLTILDRIR